MRKITDRYTFQFYLSSSRQRCFVAIDKETGLKRFIKKNNFDNPDELKKEVVNAGEISHPNIVKVLNLERTDDGNCYLICEYIPGPDLEQVFKVCGPLKEFENEIVIPIANQIFEGFKAVSDSECIYKDGKPSNFVCDFGWTIEEHKQFQEDLRKGKIQAYRSEFLNSLRKHPRVALIDFGSSEKQTHRSKAYSGTRLYSSLEHLLCQTIDKRSDIYEVGAALYFSCSGKRHHLTNEELSIAAKNPDYISKKLEKGFSPAKIEGMSDKFNLILCKMLNTDKTKRYSDMSEVIAALKSGDEELNETLVYAGDSNSFNEEPIISSPINEDSDKRHNYFSSAKVILPMSAKVEGTNYLLTLLFIFLAAAFLQILPKKFGLDLPLVLTSALLGTMTFIYLTPLNLAEYKNPTNCALGMLTFSLVAILSCKIPLLLNSVSLKMAVPEAVGIIISAMSLWMLTISYNENNKKTGGF